MSEARDPPIREEPPEPPDLARRVHLYRVQWFGLPILFLLPILALVGVFGERRAEQRLELEDLVVRVDYPTRIRAGVRTDASVHLRGVGTDPIRDVSVHWDPAYLHRFRSPEPVLPAQIAAAEGIVVGPGEERIVRIELDGDELWSHRGSVRISVGSTEIARVNVQTFVFP